MSIRLRLALALAALVGMTAMAIGAASFVTTDRQVVAEIDDFLRDRAEELVDGTRSQPDGRSDKKGRDNDDDRRDDDDTVVVAFDADAEVQLIDTSGEVLSNSGLLLPVDTRDVEVATEQARTTIRTVAIDGEDHRLLTRRVDGVGAVQVARSLDESNSLLNALRSRIALIAGLLSLLAALGGWLLARRITQPLESLTNAVDSVAETGDFGAPLAELPADPEGDEVARLATGFRNMFSALQLSREQQKRLVRDAAHELRTPLTSASANVDWLRNSPDLAPEVQAETLESVRRELRELNAIVGEIVDLATDERSDAPHFELDLASVVRQQVDHFTSRTGRQVKLDLSPTTVMGDPDGLGRAISNLLGNAHKYSPAESPIEVTVANGALSVVDHGPGIPVEERDAIFDRFYRRTEHRSQPGSGLGLAIVARIVSTHGGTVSAGEGPTGGAKVGFRLPEVTSSG